MTTKLLKNTKDKKTINQIDEIEDKIYKIDFDEESIMKQEVANEIAPDKNLNNKVNEIIKIEDDDDEIDDVFGNINKWLENDDEDIDETQENSKTKKKLTKVEEGIKTSKTVEISAAKEALANKNIKAAKKKAEKEKKKTEKTITNPPKKRGRKPKNMVVLPVLENGQMLNIETIADKQSAIKMHTENNLTEILLIQNKYKIEIQKNEYNIYTESNETSYIIVREPTLRIVSGGVYILIEKQNEDYAITTNQDFKINYVIDNLERKNNVVNFKLTNLTEIEATEEGLTFIIDEEKIIENNLEDNKTLIISEEDGKVYLPYTKEDVKQEVLQNKGTKITDVIENKYILPLDKYKNSIRARFREGYNLMYKKEGKSKKSAILLGIELMFESNLHPAIISACKTLEELDIYLDCLEDNELEKFSCFKIIYKSLPTLRKKAKFQES